MSGDPTWMFTHLSSTFTSANGVVNTTQPSILHSIAMTLPAFNLDLFLQSGGIYERTIENLFGSEIFFLGRESVHTAFFLQFLANDASCLFLQNLLYELVVSYYDAYGRCVKSTVDDIDKRMKSGKIMMKFFESDRNKAREVCGTKFSCFQIIRSLFDEPQNEEVDRSVSEHSNLLFSYLEDFVYKNFWKFCVHFNRGLDIDNYITERSSIKFKFTQKLCFTRFMILRVIYVAIVYLIFFT